MKIKKKYWLIPLAILITLVLVLPAIGFAVLKWGILPPEKLTPLVVREVNKMIDGELQCEQIELTFFETYPRLGVRLTNGVLLSSHPADTLIQFSRAVVTVQPLDYFLQNRITIPGIFLENPSVYGYVDENGKANWDIYSGETDPEEATAPEEEIPQIDLQRIHVKGGYFVYEDLASQMYAAMDDFSLRLKGSLLEKGGNAWEIETGAAVVRYEDQAGNMYTELEDFSLNLKGAMLTDRNYWKMETGAASMRFESPSYTLANQLSWQFKSKLRLTDHMNQIRLEDAELMINNLPFTARGDIHNMPDSNRVYLDVEMGLKVSDLNDLFGFIPDELFLDKNKIKAEGSIMLEGAVKGFLGDSIVPTVDLCCQLENGSLFRKGVKQGFDAIDLDVDIHLNGTHPDSSFISLQKLNVQGLNTHFSLKGKVTHLLQSPLIDASMQGKIDFTRLASEFLNPDTLYLRGAMEADMTALFRVDDLLEGRYNDIRAGGQLTIDSLVAASRVNRFRLFIKDARFHVDSTKQTSSFLTNEDLLTAFLKVDSMAVQYNRQIHTNLRGLDMQAKTSPVIDTAEVMPLTGHIKVEYLRTRLPDSVWLVAHNSYFRGGIKASESDKKMPVLGAAITVDTLRYIDIPLRSGGVLAGSTFGIEALPYRDAMRQRMQAQSQNRRETNRPSATNRSSSRTNSTSRTSGERTRLRTDSIQGNDNPNAWLRRWEARGTVKFNQMRMFSRMFPLPMRMDETTVRFDTNQLTFKDAHLHVGKSNFVLNGELNSLRRAMLNNGKLTGNFAVHSDYIDMNQLMHAMSVGLVYLDENPQISGEEEEITEEMEQATNMENEMLIAASDTTELLFVIPEFLDMTLQTKVARMDFKDVEFENVDGEVVVRNQSLNLRKLNMESSLGSGNLTMVYTAKDLTGASAGFELDLENIQVERLIGMFPAIDSLLPMLRSFEGVVDCQMAATCDIDSTMSIILPSLHTACYLHGENMVLLDGETFSEISKTLMFKNKNRNLIDSISVDMVIRENKIEIFPFLVEMDRYRVAVGGTHNLDMTFDYHLSVLKSPVPFKLGIDITGNLDKFKYRIVKCRYKDIFKPAREAELDSTRVNLRTEIREAIRRDMQANAPELARDLNFSNTVRRERTTPRPPRPRIEEEEEEQEIEEISVSETEE